MLLFELKCKYGCIFLMALTYNGIRRLWLLIFYFWSVAVFCLHFRKHSVIKLFFVLEKTIQVTSAIRTQGLKTRLKNNCPDSKHIDKKQNK